MRVRLTFDNQAAFDEIRQDIEVTAAIEGGAGAVRLGTPAQLSDGRVRVVHAFTQVDADWIEIYASDPRMPVEVEES